MLATCTCCRSARRRRCRRATIRCRCRSIAMFVGRLQLGEARATEQHRALHAGRVGGFDAHFRFLFATRLTRAILLGFAAARDRRASGVVGVGGGSGGACASLAWTGDEIGGIVQDHRRRRCRLMRMLRGGSIGGARREGLDGCLQFAFFVGPDHAIAGL